MSFTNSMSPVSLSYTAALRGINPRQPGEAFVYVCPQVVDADYFVCLAASNPEGEFFGLISNAEALKAAQTFARARQVNNVTFAEGTATSLLTAVREGRGALPEAHYIVTDQNAESVTTEERENLFELAKLLLAESGILNVNYRPYQNEEGSLRFLVREFAPEMNETQKVTFLRELKTLGGFFFSKQRAIATKLDQAIAKSAPDEFFAPYISEPAQSITFDTLVGLRKRGFAYAGDSQIQDNYAELSVPAEAQDLILSCQQNHLYEPMKDFVLNRTMRSDIWIKPPYDTTKDLSALFGGFSYGISMAREQVPSEVKAQGKIIDLKSDLYQKLIEVMTMMPVSIGDFLAHPSGEAFLPIDIIGALQILVACKIARPMRGLAQNENISNVRQPRLMGNFNQYLGSSVVSSSEIRLASTIVGSPVTLSARDALVIQALDRVGLADSVKALLPELERLAKNPALAARVMDTTDPTEAVAHSMVDDIVSKSIVQWYAYGLLKAA